MTKATTVTLQRHDEWWSNLPITDCNDVRLLATVNLGNAASELKEY
jgi:hypothetical protein